MDAAIAKGKIGESAFSGDFLSRASLDEVVADLRGCPFEPEEVSGVLDRFSLQDCFGGITKEEVLETMFHIHE